MLGNVGFELQPCILGYLAGRFRSVYKFLVFQLGDDAHLLTEDLYHTTVLRRQRIVVTPKAKLVGTRSLLLSPPLYDHASNRLTSSVHSGYLELVPGLAYVRMATHSKVRIGLEKVPTINGHIWQVS